MELDRNQALKRIREEYREIESNPSREFMCGLLKRKKFQWQFAIRGASGTEFEGGIYHGRVLFPREYPCKPPSIIALTENGRFKTHTEISLRRLDKWQPSYRVRDVFVEFVHLMPTPTYPDELHSLECNEEERRALAIKSRAAAPNYGTSQRQKVIDQIHQCMLSKAPNGTGGGSVPSQASNGTGGIYNIFWGVNIIGNKHIATNSDSNGTGGGSVPSQASNGTGGIFNIFWGVNIIGNKLIATNSGNKLIATNSDSNGTGGGSVPSQASNGTGGGSVPSQASNGTGGIYNIFWGVSIIGNKLDATNSDRVGILGCMNGAGVGILGSMYEPFIRDRGTLGPVWCRTPTLFVFFFFK